MLWPDMVLHITGNIKLNICYLTYILSYIYTFRTLELLNDTVFTPANPIAGIDECFIFAILEPCIFQPSVLSFLACY